MPRDLFRDVVARPPSVKSRRSPMLVISIVVHAAVLLAVLLASAIAPHILPTPREVLAFYEPARLVDIKLPPPPPSPRQLMPAQPSAPSVSVNAAPLVPPSDITPETWLPPPVTTSSGITMGVSDGIGTDIVGAPEPLPAPAPTAPERPVRLHGGIIAPEKTVNVPPIYPQMARETRTEGIVILEAVIDHTGLVTSVRVLRGHPLLDQAALDAVRQWKFTPARLNNEPIPVVMTVTVQFRLQ